MKKTIVITDLTIMAGDRVCIVGIDQDSRCIRPVLPPPGVLRQNLYVDDKLAIRPRARVRFNFRKHRIEPPHIEDLDFDPKSVVYKGLCSEHEWEQVLSASSFCSVQDIYDGCLQANRWVEPGANTRSVGTVSRIRLTGVYLYERSGERRYRLYFTDQTGCWYNDVTISDLVFRAFCDNELNRNVSPESVSQRITGVLKSVDRLYLRLGLARPWAPGDGRYGPRCWMQVIGIHTFPDYLEGRTFTDFEATTQISKAKAYDVEEIREHYPRAYAKWTEYDDNILRDDYLRGQTIDELARDFQRKPGAIRSRLLRLGLMPNK